MTSGQRNHAATILSTEFFNSLGYGLPVEADEGASAMRSQTGRFEAEHEALGGRPVRQE